MKKQAVGEYTNDSTGQQPYTKKAANPPDFCTRSKVNVSAAKKHKHLKLLLRDIIH